MTSTAPQLPQSHFVEVVNAYASDGQEELPKMIEEAYTRLNLRALESACVITNITTSFSLCPVERDTLAVYIITAQIIPRAELEKLHAAQRFEIQGNRRLT